MRPPVDQDPAVGQHSVTVGVSVRRGLLAVVPFLPGLVPIWIIVGSTAVDAGFSLGQVAFMAATVNIATPLLPALAAYQEGVPAVAVVGIVVMVASRFLLLNSAVRTDLVAVGAGGPMRLGVLHWITEETYAVMVAWRDRERFALVALVVLTASFYAASIVGAMIGGVIGARLPDLRSLGLDYALPGVFVGLLGIFIKERKDLVAAIVIALAAASLGYAGWGVVAVIGLPLASIVVLRRIHAS